GDKRSLPLDVRSRRLEVLHELGAGTNDRRPTVVDDVRELLAAQAEVDGNADRLDLAQAGGHLEARDRVEGLDGYPVARGDAQRQERVRCPAGALVVGGV